MKKITLLTVIFTFSFAFNLLAQKGTINPAAAYCEMLGYKYEVANDKDGQFGVVHFPNGEQANAWDFFKGKVGQEFSYAAKHGYVIETAVTEKNGFVSEEAICSKLINGKEISISLLDLMKQNGDALDIRSKEDIPDIYARAKEDLNFSVAKSIPTSFDWRDYNGHSYIGAPRDQGGCGSCYSFGAAAAAEGAYNFATGNYDGNTANFSEAYIAWCLSTMSPYSGHFSGCNGADYDYYELQALCDVGIIDESYFPYTDSDNQNCPSSTSSAPKTVFEDWYRVPCADNDAIKTAIMTYGVVDAAVYVTNDFSAYSGGIYTDNTNTCNTSPCYNATTNHAISLVGWGYDATYGDYWILRNSWGSSWGESGYMRIDADAAHVDCAVCYLTYANTNTTTPTIASANVSNIGDYSATCGGNITDDGGASITASGLVYSTSSNPTLANGTVIETSPTITNGTFTLTMNNLLSGTDYYVRAFATNSNGTSYGSEQTFTTTGDQQLVYCTSAGANYSYEWIAGVEIGSFNNTSGAAGYTDFTGTTIDMEAGNSYNIALTPGFSGSSYNEYWMIWIDLNHDGDFSDANETVFDAGSMSKTEVTGTITIPSTTTPVTTRMRVTMKYNGAPTACEESFSYGEVEDYTVIITGGDTQAPSAPANLSSSNVTQTSADLSWSASSDNVGVTGYDIYKNNSLLTTTTGTSYTATGLTASTTYQFYVKAKDAAGNVSAASSTLSVTTEDEIITDCYESMITLTLTFDNYPAETSWDIKDASNSIVASGNNYSDKGATITEEFNLDGDFTFTIYDSYGDGICCSYGNGSYELIDANNEVIASGGSFGSSESTEFCAQAGSTPIEYCASQGNNYSYEWIAGVEIGSYSNTSAAAGYTDFTSETVNVNTGTTAVTLTPGFKSSSYNEYWKIWVDLNADGDFEDTDELVFDAGSMSKTTVTGNMDIPTSAAGVTTRMRVSMKYNGAPTSCEAFSYGEVEDYTISIGSRNAIAQENTVTLESKVYPNPVENTLYIQTSDAPVEMKIFNAMGKLVEEKQLNDVQGNIDVSQYPAGIYTICVVKQGNVNTLKFIKR